MYTGRLECICGIVFMEPRIKDEIIKIKINYASGGSINGSLAKLLIQKIN